MNLGLYLSSASCHFTEAMQYAHLHDWFVKLEKNDKQTKPSPTHRLLNKPFIKTFNQTTSWHLWNRPIRSVRSTVQNWLCGFPVTTQVCQPLWRQLRWETSDRFIFFTRSGKSFSNLIFNIPSVAHFPDRLNHTETVEIKQLWDLLKWSVHLCPTCNSQHLPWKCHMLSFKKQ